VERLQASLHTTCVKSCGTKLEHITWGRGVVVKVAKSKFRHGDRSLLWKSLFLRDYDTLYKHIHTKLQTLNISWRQCQI
jgi:hypothetical protein